MCKRKIHDNDASNRSVTTAESSENNAGNETVVAYG